jgi:chromosome segregation ATPase
MLALTACAGSKEASKPVTVSDPDYGRLGPAQTAAVDQARITLGDARDELARAKLRQTQTAQAINLAQADMTVAEAELKRAEARAKLANESLEPAQLAEARTLSESAQLRQAAAQSRLDFAKKIQDARAAEVAAAEKRVAFEEVRVEQAKLQALQQAQVPAAAKYDGAQLDSRVAAARKEFEAAQANAQKTLSDAAGAEQRWNELSRKLQAQSGGAGPRG